MKADADFLLGKEVTVKYAEAITGFADVRKLLLHLHTGKVTTIHIADVAGNWLQKRITIHVKNAI